MTARFSKPILSLVVVGLLCGAFVLERGLNSDRDRLGLTRYPELKGAPPLLALTTVALGGFRGLISNALWIRSSDLQDAGKYFEMVQLADWITKLEPHFSQVWANLAWNMAYNISVKFEDPRDRWRWLQRGIELLRDEGLKYNPHDILLHRELGWLFQHKMGANLDDAHWYYIKMWHESLTNVFGEANANFDKLINPQTEEDKARASLLREKFKMDPAFMKVVDEKYGPLEWRLPEAHAIYWAEQGLEDAKLNPRKVDPNDFILLRRVIYQSMQLAMRQGRLIEDAGFEPLGGFRTVANLTVIPKVNRAYEQAMEEDAKNRDHIEVAHRNFLADAVFFLYVYNRQADAVTWYKYLAAKYPDKALLERQPTSIASKMSLDEYAMARVQGEVGDTGREKTQFVITGLIGQSYRELAIGEHEESAGLAHLAEQIRQIYENKLDAKSRERVGLPDMASIRLSVLKDIVAHAPPEIVSGLRGELGTLPTPDAPATNAPMAMVSTNASAGATPATNVPATRQP